MKHWIGFSSGMFFGMGVAHIGDEVARLIVASTIDPIGAMLGFTLILIGCLITIRRRSIFRRLYGE